MRHLYLLIFLLIFSLAKAQLPTPNVIYYPNTISTPTALSLGYMEYLCGPNTVVYDTIGHACKIYVSNNCTLTLKTTCSACAGVTNVFLQGNSVLNIFPGNCYNYYVASEPTATINNPMNVPVSSNTFATISWPTVNCSANGIRSNNMDNTFEIYPNPVKDKLTVDVENKNAVDINFSLTNSLGQLIHVNSKTVNSQLEIDTSELPIGFYYLKVQNNSGQKVFKIGKE